MATSRSTIMSVFIQIYHYVRLHPDLPSCPSSSISTIMSVFTQIYHHVRLHPYLPSCPSSPRPTIMSVFTHLVLVLLLSGEVELYPRPSTPSKSSTLSTNYPCGRCQTTVRDSRHHALRVVDVRQQWETVVTTPSCVINMNCGLTLIAWWLLSQIILLY